MKIMKVNFFSYDKTGKMAIKVVENDDVRFFGFVKSSTKLTEEMDGIAYSFLNELFSVWTERYHSIFWKEHSCEFRYESLKRLELMASKLIKEKGIDPEKTKMSITAACIFPRKEKSFWLNTGSEMIYVDTERNVLIRSTSKKKELATVKAQSIFSADKDFSWKAEGGVIDTPRTFWIVSSEFSEFFEEFMTKRGGTLSREEFNAFSHGRKKPIIIGEINGD